MKFKVEGSLERYLALKGVRSISEAVDKSRGLVQSPVNIPVQPVVVEKVMPPVRRNSSDPWKRDLHLLISYPNGKLSITDYET